MLTEMQMLNLLRAPGIPRWRVRLGHWILSARVQRVVIAVIVSTMQELSVLPDPDRENPLTLQLLTRIEDDLAELKRQLAEQKPGNS